MATIPRPSMTRGCRPLRHDPKNLPLASQTAASRRVARPLRRDGPLRHEPPDPATRVKLHLDRPGGTNLISASGGGTVTVNQTAYRGSLIVLRERLVEDWAPSGVLESAQFELLAGLGADIVLLGTGNAIRFPHPRLTARLLSARIGLEVMDTGAACRTYNILSGEGRNVAAALVIE